MGNIDISVIIVNYNTSDYTINCIQSIYEKTKLTNFETIVIDNNSRPEEYQKLRALEKFQNTKLIRSRFNGGFSYANMLGVNLASGDYYYFLNNDTLFVNDVLDILHQFMGQHQEASICSGQMYDELNHPQVNFNYFPSIGLKLLGSGIMRLTAPNNYPKKKADYQNTMNVPLVNGSSMFVRASLFDKIGGFDLNYFLYCEEEDIAYRLRKLGTKVYLVPQAKYIHFMHKSTGENNKANYELLKEFYISQGYFYSKHYSPISRSIWRIVNFFKAFRKGFGDKTYFKLAYLFIANPTFSKSLRHKHAIGTKI